MSPSSTTVPDLSEFRSQFMAWLDRERSDLERRRGSSPTLRAETTFVKHLYGRLWQEGFTRWGWPRSVGGNEGPAILRAIVAEQLLLVGLVHETIFMTVEAYAAPVAQFASEALVQTYVAPYVRGEELWCQGFSEPGAGSDLANLSTRAVPAGDGFVINGQKVWTTIAHHAQRCVLLARTGAADSAHRGLTAFLIDMTTPGVEVRPIKAMHGEEEFCEVFLTDVRVPANRIIGEVNKGWSVALAVLAAERANIFWGWAAWLHGRLNDLLKDRFRTAADAERLGEAYQMVTALRARSRLTQYATAEGRFDSAAASVDKVLMATAHQSLFDASVESLDDDFFFKDSAPLERWRKEYLYSRAASIYGGTGEIQRNIIAERLLGLPRS